MEVALKVKDFVIDVGEKKKEIKAKKQQQRSIPQHTYEVILQNNIDFVINRKTSTTDKSLVYLVSQGVFYIKDNKTEEVEHLNESRIRAFFQNIYYDKFDKLDKVQWWNNSSPKNKVEKMMDIIINKNLQKLYQHNIFPQGYELQEWSNLFNLNVKLFKYCHDKIYNTINKSSFISIVKLALEINNTINYNNAAFFIDKLSEANIYFNLREGYSNNFSTLVSLLDKYNLNFNRYIEYILYDLYSQGITHFESNVLSMYKDYLDMQVSLFGHIKEKYPKYLKTEHDIIALKVYIYKKHQKDLMLLNVVDNHKKLEYRGKEYSIILPQSSMDIVDEGINLSHCVASYVDNVVENKKLILFLRKSNELDKSLITIEVINNAVTQVAGFANRLPEPEEVKFLRKWIKEKKLLCDLRTIINE